MRIEPQFWDPESCQPKLAHQLREILPTLMRVLMREKDGSQRAGNIANWEKKLRNQRILQKERMSQSEKAFSWQRKNKQTQKEFEKRKNVIRESICHDRQRKNLRKSFLMTEKESEKAFVMTESQLNPILRPQCLQILWLNFLPSNRPLPLLPQTGENICSRFFFY